MQTTREPKQTDSARSSAEKLAEELKKLSAAVLWKNHRATDEVKDAVRLVASELARTAETIRSCAPALATLRDETAVQGHLALLEAKDKLTLLDDLVRSALDGASESPTFIGETARLKLALARMDATDLFEEKRRLLTNESRRIEAMTDATMKDIESRLDELAAAVDRKKK